MAKILILDIDETLVHTILCQAESELRRYEKMYKLNSDRIFKPFKNSNYYVLKRPGLEEFLQRAYEYFDYVAIWSAGTYSYVHCLCDHIFLNMPDPAFILTRNDCSINKNGRYYKDLNWIHDNVTWLPQNTYLLLLDDVEDNIDANKYNSYKIKKFTGRSLRKRDDELCTFMDTVLTDDQ